MAFFDVRPLIKEYNPQYLLCYGQRSNGKSWSVKQLVFDRFMKDKSKFIYVRRYDQDLKAGASARYFSKFIAEGGLKKCTKGAYSNIIARASEFYLVKSDKSKEKELCGYYIPLSTASERIKSQEFPDVTTIIFEEFLTNRVYLEDEYQILQSLVSSVARGKLINVIMIGNTVSRVCPYFAEMGIPDIVDSQPGTHKLYHQHNHRGDITDILVVHTPETDVMDDSGRSMFFGRSSKMILSGEWDVEDFPIRPKKMKFETNYEMGIHFKLFDFILQFQTGEDEDGNENPYIFVYPNKHKRRIDRLLTEETDMDPLHTPKLREDIKAEMIIRDLWRMKKVFYSDLLTANDFNSCLANSDMLL